MHACIHTYVFEYFYMHARIHTCHVLVYMGMLWIWTWGAGQRVLGLCGQVPRHELVASA